MRLLCALLVLIPAALSRAAGPAAVAADHPAASAAGAEMLRQGGNAVDAAVAAAFMLSVVEPYACGIGGGGFMLISLTDDPRTDDAGDPLRLFIDFRETAPAAVDAEFFVNQPTVSSRDGAHAVAVPGSVAGLLSALDRFGTLDRATVIAPALAAARDGFAVTPDYAETAASLRRWFRDLAHQERFAFVWNEMIGQGEIEAGAELKNPGHARALELIAEQGADAFYTGEIAEAIVRTIQADGGVMTAADLAAYAPVDREPISGSVFGREMIVAPPPSSGGVAMVQVFGLLERFAANTGTDLAAIEHNSVEWMHLLSEVFKHAFADRNAYMGDADFADVPWNELIEPAHLDALAARVMPSEARHVREYGRPGLGVDVAPPSAPVPDDAGTSHLSIIDAAGNAVACTLTVNTDFGSKLVVDGFGFVLNNEMDDFTARPGRANAYGLTQSTANAPAPGKRPLSSMSPTIVFGADGNVELVAGASGGPRIITGTIQAILNSLVFEMSADDAVGTPRVHDQLWPPALQLEPEWDLTNNINPDDIEALQRWLRNSKRNERMRFALTGMGHPLRRIEEVAAVQLVRVTADGIDAASDPRKGGEPVVIEE